MTVQAIVPSNGPEKTRYLERMSKKFDEGMKNIHHTFNFEAIAKEYGGTALYSEYMGMPAIMANGVEFPDQETHDRAWEGVFGTLNKMQDEIELGNAVLFEFGDSTDPNYDLKTEQGKINHALLHRKRGGPLSIHDAELVEKGILGKYTGTGTRVDNVDNWDPVKHAAALDKDLTVTQI
jgi:hypothetical protein